MEEVHAMPEYAPTAVARLMAMVSWIGSQPAHSTTVGELADHFHRTLTQAERDLENLTHFNDSFPGDSFELTWESPPKRTSVEQRRATPVSIRSTLGLDLPPSFTENEAAAIIVGLQAIGPYLDEELRSAIPSTVLAVDALSPTVSTSVEDILTVNDMRWTSDLHLIDEALRTPRPLSFSYISPSGRKSDRTIDPWTIRLGPNGWIVEGWCWSARAARQFSVERMTGLSLSDETATHPRPHAEEGTSESLRFAITRGAQWIIDEYSIHVLGEKDGILDLTIDVWDRQWVRNLFIRISPYIVRIDDAEMECEISEYATEALTIWNGILSS